LQIKIEKLVYGGSGIGRSQGKAIFVDGGVPGDLLDVEIINDKRDYAESKIDKIIKPSPERTEPLCPVFGICGGCQWQHMNYSLQLKAKEEILSETLFRIGGIREPVIEPIVSSPKEYYYRKRVTLSIWPAEGRYFVGYHEGKSLDKVPIAGCPIASEEINLAINKLSDSISHINEDIYFPFDRVHISSENGEAYITLMPYGYLKSKDREIFSSFLGDSLKPESGSFSGESECVFEFDLLGLKFFSTPSEFVQANKRINETLIETVIDWAEPSGEDNVLELYSGIGNFSLHLAKKVKRIDAVDINRKAIRLAKRSADKNSIGNVAFHFSSSERFIFNAVKRGRRYNLVLLDPPREGAREILKGLIEMSPDRIIYVSCNPATLARDLKRLIEGNYRIMKIRPFDMFPQTYHIETVALLKKEV